MQQSTNEPQHVVATMEYSGDVPPPVLLAQFKEVDPSFPERIFKMTEAQNNHIIELENKTLHVNFISKLIGQIFILSLIILFLVFTMVSFWFFKNNIAGVVGIIAAVSTTVSTAIQNLHKQ